MGWGMEQLVCGCETENRGNQVRCVHTYTHTQTPGLHYLSTATMGSSACYAPATCTWKLHRMPLRTCVCVSHTYRRNKVRVDHEAIIELVPPDIHEGEPAFGQGAGNTDYDDPPELQVTTHTHTHTWRARSCRLLCQLHPQTRMSSGSVAELASCPYCVLLCDALCVHRIVTRTGSSL